jgi:HPt (histidine-containing phosphotransfer) domain-containing protein
MGNLEFVERVLSRFEQCAGQDLQDLQRAVELGETERVIQIAHRIKGSSANISAEGLQHQAGKVEELGRSGRVADIPAEFAQLRREWEQYLRCLAEPSPAADTRV